MGACDYVLARATNGKFTITAQNVACGSTGVTCTKSVTVRAGAISIKLMRGSTIQVRKGEEKKQFRMCLVINSYIYIYIYIYIYYMSDEGKRITNNFVYSSGAKMG